MMNIQGHLWDILGHLRDIFYFFYYFLLFLFLLLLCSLKSILGFLLSERTSGVSPVIFTVFDMVASLLWVI